MHTTNETDPWSFVTQIFRNGNVTTKNVHMLMNSSEFAKIVKLIRVGLSMSVIIA